MNKLLTGALILLSSPAMAQDPVVCPITGCVTSSYVGATTQGFVTFNMPHADVAIVGIAQPCPTGYDEKITFKTFKVCSGVIYR